MILSVRHLFLERLNTSIFGSQAIPRELLGGELEKMFGV